MRDFIGFLFETAPWLRPVVGWSIAFLIVVLILTVPAYFIVWPFLERARAQMAAFIGRLAERLAEVRSKREARLNSAADEFLEDGGLWRLTSGGEGHWAALMARLARVLKKLRKPVGKAAESLDTLNERIPSLQKALQQSEISKLQVLPEMPEATELAESAAELRVASRRVAMVGTILLGLMLVNTGMLSQILRDLGVVPAAMTFAGIPLAYVFAFILTLAEAGIGVAHGIAKRSVNPEKISILPAVIAVFAVIVACVEGFFYSRIAPSGATFRLPFLDYEMPQSDLFFFWGFVLVMTLFILGFMGYESCESVWRGSRSSTLQREINKLRKRHERYAGVVKRSGEALNEAKVAATDADKAIQGPAVNSESVRQELDRVRMQVEALNNKAPEWARGKEVALTRTEVYQLAQTGGLWLMLALLGVVVMTITGLNGFAAFNPGLNQAMLWAMAVGQAVVFFGVGSLLGVGETVVQGNAGERRVWAAPRFSHWGAYLIGSLLVVSYIALFFAVAWPIGLGGVWFSNLVVGLFLIAAGYQLSPLLNVVRLWLWRLWNAAVLVLEVLWLAVMRLLQLLLVIMENVFYLLATPLDKVFRRRREMAESASGVGHDQHAAIESGDPLRR